MSEEILTQEQIDDIAEAIQGVVDAVVEVFKRIVEAIRPVVEGIVEFFKTAWNAMISAYANKRVRHLALHAKKHRTRKKNLHRMQKDFIRLLGV